MLSERKRFNYMVNANHSTSHNKVYHSSGIKANTVQDSEPHLQRLHNQDKENLRNKYPTLYSGKNSRKSTENSLKKLLNSLKNLKKMSKE